jgi:hypothetical protein
MARVSLLQRCARRGEAGRHRGVHGEARWGSVGVAPTPALSGSRGEPAPSSGDGSTRIRRRVPCSGSTKADPAAGALQRLPEAVAWTALRRWRGHGGGRAPMVGLDAGSGWAHV